jgi:hypothetical protein
MTSAKNAERSTLCDEIVNCLPNRLGTRVVMTLRELDAAGKARLVQPADEFAV